MRKVESGDVYYRPNRGQVLLYVLFDEDDQHWCVVNMSKCEAYTPIEAFKLVKVSGHEPVDEKEEFLFNVNKLPWDTLYELLSEAK